MHLHSCLLAFAVGIAALQQQAMLPALGGAWLALGWLVLVVIGAVYAARVGYGAAFKRALASAAILGLAACGFYYAAWRGETRLADALAPAFEGRDVEVVGVIDELPQRSDRGFRFAFDVERSETPDAIIPTRISLSWYAARGDTAEALPPAVHAGERWQFTVRLRRPHGSVNPHGFDIEAWLLENNLRATGYVRTAGGNQRLDAFAGRVSDYVERERERIRDRILETLEGRRYAQVIAALTIGDERGIPATQWQLFNRTGVGHLISISGLHVTFFAALVSALTLFTWRRSQRLTTWLPARKAAALAGVTAAFVYVLLAGFQVPAQRTLYMLTVAAIGLWVGRAGTAATVWLWALVTVLTIDPWAVLSAGFWLSFFAVGLLLYTGVGRLGPGGALIAAMRAQWAITLGLTPLMLMLFQQVSIISPVANAFAIPIVTFAVVPLALASIVIPWSGLLIVAHTVFEGVAIGLSWVDTLPSSVWQQHAPPPWAIIVGLLGVVLLLAPRGVPARWLGLVWLMPLFLTKPDVPAPGTFRLTVLDVGQGLAVVIETHAHVLLYDTGPRYSADADSGNRIIAPYLRAAGLPRLEGLMISHNDSDHSGGALSLMQLTPIAWLASSLAEDSPIVHARVSAGELALKCVAGQRWGWDGVSFAVLHPTAESYGNPKLKPNDRSCVVRVESVTGSVLLTGDIEAKSEAEMLARDRESLRARVLVVPHHGSRTSSTTAFIEAVKPEVAIFTPGYRNRFGHPRPEIVGRYVERGIRTYRSDYDGAVSIDFNRGEALVPEAERERNRRYWREAPKRGATSLE